VRNNLQLVYGLLSRQLRDTQDAEAQKGIKAIARRVSTLAQVYDNLLGTDMARTTDFAVYLKSLCLKLAAFQANSDASVTLHCACETFMLDLDTVTALGIVVAELVTNSYDHAFSLEAGAITVAVGRCEGDIGMATMTIVDDGVGFVTPAGANRQGLGLVKRLVEQLRGTVNVVSDKGTRWTIRFPVPVQP
jgi:two-component sensor histidine kinase